MSSVNVTTHKQILIDQKNSSALPCLVSKTGVVVNSDGEYVVKAGTPLYGDIKQRDSVALTIASTGESTAATKPQGVLYQDIVFDSGASTANGTLVYVGTVDLLKLDLTTKALITSAVESALPAVHFVNGRAD